MRTPILFYEMAIPRLSLCMFCKCPSDCVFSNGQIQRRRSFLAYWKGQMLSWWKLWNIGMKIIIHVWMTDDLLFIFLRLFWTSNRIKYIMYMNKASMKVLASLRPKINGLPCFCIGFMYFSKKFFPCQSLACVWILEKSSEKTSEICLLYTYQPYLCSLCYKSKMCNWWNEQNLTSIHTNTSDHFHNDA